MLLFQCIECFDILFFPLRVILHFVLDLSLLSLTKKDGHKEKRKEISKKSTLKFRKERRKKKENELVCVCELIGEKKKEEGREEKKEWR